MKFSELAEYFGRIETTSLRNQKTTILAELMREANVEEIDKLVYLSLGGLRPAFDRLEFNLAEKMILRALGKTVQEFQQIGDLGELVQKLKNERMHKRTNEQMSVTQVYELLEKIARDSGTGSQERKVGGLAKLIKESDPQSAKYIVRMVAGKLRLGFSDKTVIDALSYMENGTKEYSDALERAYQIRPDVGVLARMIKELGVVKAVDQMTIALGTPIVPVLAQRLKTATEMIEKMGRVYVEPKYDGTRVQIHFKRNEFESSNNQAPNSKQIQNSNNQTMMFEEEKPKFWVRTFTRNLDESSAMFPELQSISAQIKASEVILDAEAVGYDPKTGKLVPFQLTITRKRKHGVSEAQSSVPLRFFVFDIMYRDGESLIYLPLSQRRNILAATILGDEVLVVDEYIETEDPDVLRDYHAKQLVAGLEGVLVKQKDGQYMPGRTGFNWVKFKESEDSRAKLADTLDVVILGYYKGRGKRQKFGVGAFLVGIQGNHQAPSTNNQTRSNNQNPNTENDAIVTIAKVGTGITDEIFGELGARLKKIETTTMPGGYIVPKTLEPDVWVEPRIVVEVAADEITISPTHSAGYALRFPRLVKFRDDKGIEQITTKAEVEQMLGI